MDFTDLIQQNSEPITVLVPGEGHRDWDNGGEWKEESPQEQQEMAAVFPIGQNRTSESRLQYGEGGTYSISDIKVYILKKLAIGEKVKWKNKTYTISEEIDHTSHSKDLYIYLCKRGAE